MEICQSDDNSTMGIILYPNKNDAVIRYTLGDKSDIGVLQAKYNLEMPSEEELRREIEFTREKFRLIHEKKEIFS